MHPLSNWKKLAAAQMSVDDNQVEKAFLDSAYTLVANKARAIMQAPYRLGFEVVFKNEDNTRMVGIFAFRIAKDLYYAPVFFLNGEIKGTDLLYRHGTKTFVPLTPDWIQFLLDSDVSQMGSGVTRQFTMGIPQQLNLHRLIRPDHGSKSASADLKSEAAAHWDEFFKEAAVAKDVGPILRDFIVNDGGVSSLNLLTSAMEQSVKFANSLYTQLPEDAYMPQITATVKSAGVKAVADVILHREFDASIKCASEEFHQKGYWFEDTRKSAALVYEEPGEMQSIGEPGVYEISVKGGGLVKVFAARQSTDRLNEGSDEWLEYSFDKREVSYQLINLDTKELVQNWRKPVMGFAERENEKTDGEFPFCKKTPTSGKGYVIFDSGSGTLSRPFYVKEIKDIDDLKRLEICGEFGGRTRTLTLNPDIKAVKLSKGVVGSAARFIEVECKCTDEVKDYGYVQFPCTLVPGGQSDLDSYIYDLGMKSASVLRTGADYSVRTGAKQVTAPMSKLAAICHLIKAFELPADAAEALVEKVASCSKVGFRYEWPEAVKQARAVMLQSEPQYSPEMDSRHNVMVDPQVKYQVHTDYTPEPTPKSRMGDAWDPSMQSQFMQTATPEQLGQMSEKMKLPNVFEHGVVGQLVKTYDSSALIQKYIPKLEDAMDCLGRLLFLLYWKPQDFKQLYGADDLASKEAEILSSFKQFGDLVLSLVKQSRPERSGNVAN